jgi:hypothetical protein
LFEWVKGKCEALSESGASDDFDTNTKLQIAIRFLRKLPIYFDQCQDLLVNSRRTQLVQRFIVALTQGDGSAAAGAGGGKGSHAARALDLHAHDAARYVGGMLAWMHQAVASELEFLEAIFGDAASAERTPRSGGRGGVQAGGHAANRGAAAAVEGTGVEEGKQGADAGDTNASADAGDGTPVPTSSSGGGGLSIPQLLARCLQGLGRPLRVRIVQTLETKSSLDVLYSLTDLLSFYEDTFARITPVENAVHSAVKGCLNECKRMFLAALNKQGQGLLQSPVTYPLDLKASVVTRECAVQVRYLDCMCNCEGKNSATRACVSGQHL